MARMCERVDKTSTDLPSSTMCLREGESAGAGVRRVTGGCTASKEGNSMEWSCMRSRAGPMKRLYHCSRSEKKSDRGGCSASKDGGEEHDGVNRCPCRSTQLVGEVYSIRMRRVRSPCRTTPLHDIRLGNYRTSSGSRCPLAPKTWDLNPQTLTLGPKP